MRASVSVRVAHLALIATVQRELISPPWAVVLFVAAILLSACGAAASAPPASTGRPQQASSEKTAASQAKTTFRADIDSAASEFVGEISRLRADLERGADQQARVDELDAQGDYDRFRFLQTVNEEAAVTLDELPSDVAHGQSFGGLHAVERDLWTPGMSGHALTDSTGLLAEAPVARYLLGKEMVDPEAIATTGVEELGWVEDTAIPGREEPSSHRDAVDIVATLEAADDAYRAVAPLGARAAPSLTTSVAEQFAEVLATARSLGNPLDDPDQAIRPSTRLLLSQQVDATAGLFAKLATALAPFGTATTGPQS
jgi:iron uptake system EfeUOB component EfeO/EfeM